MNMELPEELMTLILLKVPAESLLRFKCVQKSWYSLIKSPNFTRLHRSSIKKNDSIIVRRQFFERPPRERHVLSLHSYETLDDLGDQINLPFSIAGHLELCGACDGLVCLSNYHNQILICNPTIRELRSLPVPPSFCFRINSIAFGSNPNTAGQYTVLMIGLPNFDYSCFDDEIYDDREARLYDFGTDTWRKMAVVIPGPFHYSRRAVSFNGAFHWCPWADSSNILTFHMSNEVTEFIPLPDIAQVTHHKELCVSTKSQLSLILHYYEDGGFEISVMTEYGVKESWTGLFNIGPLPLNVPRPIAFWDEQRLLLRNGMEGQLVSFDLQHQNLRHFPIDGRFDLYPFCQSLVSVNGIGKSIL